MPEQPAASDIFRVRQDAFYILLVLLHGERHGYAIMLEARERSDGSVVLQ